MNMIFVMGILVLLGILWGGKVFISWVYFRRKVLFFLLFCNLIIFCRDVLEIVFINKVIVFVL